MDFGDAVEQLRELLRTEGHVGPILWIVPEDVTFWFGTLLIRPRNESAARAEALFKEANRRGCGVALEAAARLGHSICCYVFAPDDPDDAADHFVAPPVTVKVRQELRTAREAFGLQWWLARRFSARLSRQRAQWFFGYDLDQRAQPDRNF